MIIAVINVACREARRGMAEERMKWVRGKGRGGERERRFHRSDDGVGFRSGREEIIGVSEIVDFRESESIRLGG